MSINHIADLKPDRANRRKHNPRNIGMIADALQDIGAARSIVIDDEGNILAGNGTVEAAAQAGIERVQVVDADGETIIAVRRSGLTAEQKRRLALYDNRSAELAEWDVDQLLADVDAGRDFDGLFSDDELAALLRRLPGESEWDSAFASVPDGDKSPFEQMTFTLSNDQAEQVRRALDAAKHAGAFVDTGNENSNGNALARICESYVG